MPEYFFGSGYLYGYSRSVGLSHNANNYMFHSYATASLQSSPALIFLQPSFREIFQFIGVTLASLVTMNVGDR